MSNNQHSPFCDFAQNITGQFENGDFFCFSLLSTRKRRFREPETKFFLERRVLVYVWTDGNGGFWIRWCRTYYYHYACPVLKGCYRISIVLAFSSGRAKTIQIRYLWTLMFLKTEIFSSDLKNMWIRVAIMAISEIVWFSLYSKLCAFQITAPTLLLLNSSL